MANRHEVVGKVRNVPRLEIAQDAVAVERPDLFPVDRCGAQMGYRRECVVGRVPRRRHAVIGHRRRMKVEREIVGQPVCSEDLGEQRLPNMGGGGKVGWDGDSGSPPMSVISYLMGGEVGPRLSDNGTRFPKMHKLLRSSSAHVAEHLEQPYLLQQYKEWMF